MIGKEAKNQKEVTVQEVREKLEQRKEDLEEDEELGYEQKMTLQYAQEFGKQSVERAEKAVEEIEDLGVEENLAVKLVNLMPFHKDQINLVFEKERFDVDEDQINKILKIIEDLREEE